MERLQASDIAFAFQISDLRHVHVGFKALEAAHGLRLAQPLRGVSSIGTTRFSKHSPELDHNQYTPGYSPQDRFSGHFGFGLKYEEVHLEFFARLFAATGPEPPVSRSCRSAGFSSACGRRQNGAAACR